MSILIRGIDKKQFLLDILEWHERDPEWDICEVQFEEDDQPAEYDTEEIHDNCRVQVWRNKKTGALSVGWWER